MIASNEVTTLPHLRSLIFNFIDNVKPQPDTKGKVPIFAVRATLDDDEWFDALYTTVVTT